MKNYFTIEELCYSNTADALEIDNTPSEEIISHLREMIEFLNPIRKAWGSAILITSGYRCNKLNAVIGGSETSVHQIGYAVDMIPKNGKIEEFWNFIKNFLTDNELKWDQLLLEKSKTSTWVHLGLYNNKHKQRMITSQINA